MTAEPKSVVTVGIVVDGPGQWDQELVELFTGRIQSLAEPEFEVRFPEEKIMAGDWTTVGVDAAVTRLLRDDDVDLLLALGLVASHRFCCRFDVRKPVVAAFVVDHEVQGLPKDGPGTGRPYLNYVSSPAPIERDLRIFRDLIGFHKVTVIVGQPFLDAVPDLHRHFLSAVKHLSLEIRIVPVSTSATDVLGALRRSTEAVYLGPLLNLPEGEFKKLIAGLKQRKLPSFSLTGCSEVDAGVLGSLRPRDELHLRANQVAENTVRILRGDDPAEIPVEFQRHERLCVNAVTAEAIGLSLPTKGEGPTEVVGTTTP